MNILSKRIEIMIRDIYEQGYKDASDVEYLAKCGKEKLDHKVEELDLKKIL